MLSYLIVHVDVQNVLSKPHPILGQNTSLTPFSPLAELDETFLMPCVLHENSKMLDPPDTEKQVTKPVDIHVDPLFMKYLLHNSAVLEELCKKMNWEISINPDGLSCTVLTRESSPDHTESLAQQFHHALSQMVCKIDIDIATNDIFKMAIMHCCQYGLQYSFGDRDTKDFITVAGKITQVKELKDIVKEFASRVVKTEHEFSLSSENMFFFAKCRYENIKKRYPQLKIEIIASNVSIRVIGSLHDISCFKENIDAHLAHEKILVDLQSHAITFLQNEQLGAPILKGLFSDNTIVPFFSQTSNAAHTDSLFLLCDRDRVRVAEQISSDICTRIVINSFNFSLYFYVHVANTKKFYEFNKQLAKTHPYHYILLENSFQIACESVTLSRISSALLHFVLEECSATQVVNFKEGVWRFLRTRTMEKKWAALLDLMKANNVTIVSSSKTSSKKPFIKMKGERDMLEMISAKLAELQKEVKEQKICISRPGVVQYFFNNQNGEMVVKGIETDAEVCIEIEVIDNESSMSGVDSKPGHEMSFIRIYFGNTKEGKTVNIYVGDITQFNKAEVIVNAANEDLDHSGGVALAISVAGGHVISDDSNRHVEKRGKVNTGNTVLFRNVGNLPRPYKAIVHAVGPRWSSQASHEKDCALLKKALVNSLKDAKDYSSIAIPAISSGIFGFPPSVCAKTLIKGVIEFSQNNQKSNLSDINFVLFKDNADFFLSAANEQLQSFHVSEDLHGPPSEIKSFKTRSRIRQSRKPATVFDIGSIKITHGDILKNQVTIVFLLISVFNTFSLSCRKKLL